MTRRHHRAASRPWLAEMAHNIHLRDSEPPPRVGLEDWMARVAELANKVRHGWHADDIHDLRTAMRRCRAMAEALSEVNPDPGWRKIKKSTRRLFRALGELRDTQMKLQWLKKLGPASDPLRHHVAPVLEQRIASLSALKAELQTMIEGCSHGRVVQCRVIEVLADHGQCVHPKH